MPRIDDLELTTVMDALPHLLAAEEADVERSAPTMSASDAFDIALRRSLAKLRFELNQETFERLRWRLSMLRAENQLARADAAASRMERNSILAWSDARRAARAGSRAPASRTFKADRDVLWTVMAVEGLTPAGSRRGGCLVFSSDETVTCVWDFPQDWRSLTDAELNAVRRQRTRP
jgi:hypothetical protein